MFWREVGHGRRTGPLIDDDDDDDDDMMMMMMM